MSSEANRVVDLYERNANNWDKDRGRQLFEKRWLADFLGLVPPGGSILDIGCGSAEPIAAFFIEQGFAVTGADSSPSLIDICTHRFPAQNWIVADMRSLCLDAEFNGIIAWDSFFHLSPEDQRAMFPLFRKHSAPNAALLFTSGPAAEEVIGEYRGEPLYHGSLDGAEYRELLERNGFAVASHVAEDITCGGHTIWLAQLR
jgi:cyclopropane fatty-acyl-phospholipid synthase-like methyltransferase